MNDKDILSIIFDKIEDDGCFDFDDSERETLDERVTIADQKLQILCAKTYTQEIERSCID